MGHFLPHDLSGLFSSKWWGSYSPMIPWSQQVGEHPSYASTFYPHDTATSPTFWLSTWQSQLPVSAESAADLEDPWSKPPRPCQVASSKTRTDHHTLPAEFISTYARLPLSITAEFSFDEPTVAQIYTANLSPCWHGCQHAFWTACWSVHLVHIWHCYKPPPPKKPDALVEQIWSTLTLHLFLVTIHVSPHETFSFAHIQQ